MSDSARHRDSDPAPATRVLSSSADDVAQAARLLCAGELVAFPTETVYGLGVDATNGDAIARLYAAKGRPSHNPLIVHVADADTAREWAAEWGERAAALAARFWPGPLTLVVPMRREGSGGRKISSAALAGGATVGLRCPDHPVALAILRVAGRPLAAPSANRSGHISPTMARHVMDDLSGRIAAVVDGGECRRGLESTVLDLTGARPTLLRPGPLPRRAIEAVIGSDVATLGDRKSTAPRAETLRSPGLLDRHYAPRTPARMATPDEGAAAPEDVAVLWVGADESGTQSRLCVALPSDPDAAAAQLYRTLRDLDAHGARELWIVPPDSDDPAWEAVRDRLRRATTPPETDGA